MHIHPLPQPRHHLQPVQPCKRVLVLIICILKPILDSLVLKRQSTTVTTPTTLQPIKAVILQYLHLNNIAGFDSFEYYMLVECPDPSMKKWRILAVRWWEGIWVDNYTKFTMIDPIPVFGPADLQVILFPNHRCWIHLNTLNLRWEITRTVFIRKSVTARR